MITQAPTFRGAAGRFGGVRMVVAFNSPLYVAAIVAALAGAVLLAAVALPIWGVALVSVGIALAVFWSVMSLAVSHWVYDRSIAWDARELLRLLTGEPRKLVNIHCGLDVISADLQHYISRPVDALDIYDPCVMPERSIARAHRLCTPSVPPTPARFDRLPAANNSYDGALVIFAAHELRDPASRDAFFAELRRVLRPGGQLLIVEHARDVANLIAFGPGALHFLPASVWPRLAHRAGFVTTLTRRITPFARAFVFTSPTTPHDPHDGITP